MTALVLGVIGVTALVSYWILAVRATVIEKNHLEVHGYAAASLISYELEDIGKMARDYAQWDNTLLYHQEGSEDYRVETFRPDVFENLNISHMLFLDGSGRIRTAYAYSPGASSVMPLADSDARQFMERYSEALRRYLSERQEVQGIVILGGQPGLLSISRITNTQGTVSDGFLAFVRPFGDRMKGMMEDAMVAEIAYSQPVQGEDFIPISSEPFFQMTMSAFKPEGRTSSVQLTLMDISGVPAAGIEISSTSEIWKLSRQFLVMLILVTGVSVLAILLLQMWINNTLILSPMRKLGEFLNGITDYTQLREYPVFSEHTLLREDASVIGQIHGFLRRISEDTIKLQRDRLSIRMALDSSMAGTWEYDRVTRMVRLDAQAKALLDLGLASPDIPQRILIERFHSDQRGHLVKLFNRCQANEENGFQLECQIRNKEEVYHWFLIKGDGLAWNKIGKCTLFSGILLDIDQTKRLQSELMHLSYHDKLTGLHNRRYFEEHLADFDKPENMPVTIFVADINGLKLANDAFGHDQGDRLLKKAAGSLQAAAGPGALISRWGGDEYAMLLPRTDDKVAAQIFARIKKNCDDEGLHALSLHLALGYSVKTAGTLSLNHVVRSAEENMYRDKLLESRKAHADFLEKFKTQLHDKGIETYEHCRRVADLGAAVGSRLQLSKTMLEEIALLGDLHDIGKIAMPDSLFNKTEELTGIEWALVHSHPEIGFRIVALMQDYAHLAQAVLSHHEWYDGTGYPRGLKGEEIPLIVRIVAVADAVDAMLTDHPYRAKMDLAAVINELERLKGIQFDPEIAEHMIDVLKEYPPEGAGLPDGI